MDHHASRMSRRTFNLHRREFLKLPLAAGAAGAVLAAGPITRGVGQAKPPAPAARSSRTGIDEYDPANIKLARRVPDTLSDEDMAFLAQIGLRWVRVNFPPARATFEHLRQVQQRFARHGISIYSGVHYAYRSMKVQLGRPGRDAEIERYQDFLRWLGRLEIPVACYDFHPANTYTTGHVKTRGYTAREFSLEDFRQKVEKPRFDREYSAEEIWANYTYFVKAVLPVAEQANVRLALHPDDPPVAKMNGVAKIFTHYDGYRRAERIAGDSRHWGLTFCIGTWSEGGDRMGKDVFEMIRDFGGRGKIFGVHFRNVSSPLPRFHETFPDDGYLDMYAVMKSLCEVGFNGTAVPDHIPQLEGDTGIRRAGTAYCIAYMRALLRQANEEVG